MNVGSWADNHAAALAHRTPTDLLAIMDTVRPVLDDVQTMGDAGVAKWSKHFGDTVPESLRVPTQQMVEAWNSLDTATQAALRLCKERILAFHEAQRRADTSQDLGAVRLGRRFVPVQSAGAYVPGGRAAYPSSVLMNLLPAVAAGVPRIVVCSPPGPDGKLPTMTLAALHLCGAPETYAIGGAQAIFAMALGTATVPRVRRLCGPGNKYVAAAKALVGSWCPVDAPAGPSEVLVACDGTTDVGFVVRELVAQAEHDPDAQLLVLATSNGVRDDISKELTRVQEHVRVAGAPSRAGVVLPALTNAWLLTCPTEQLPEAIDAWAPEHVVLAVANASSLLDQLHAYGSAFLGHSPVALGDYAAGTNHVLPTGGLAGAFGGLSVDHFLLAPTHQQLLEPDVRLLEAASRVARAEGLVHHAESLEALL